MFWLYAFVYIMMGVVLFIISYRWISSTFGFFRTHWGRVLYLVVFWFIDISMILAYFAPDGGMKAFWMVLRNSWLGFAAYMVQVWILMRVVQWIWFKVKEIPKARAYERRYRVIFGCILLCLTGLINVYGIIHARQTETERYEITIDKEAGKLKNLRVALVADLHLGYNIGVNEMRKMVDIINRENVDIVLMAGDIYDNDYGAIDRPEEIRALFQSIQSKYGVYACYGNHDVAETTLGGFTLEDPDIPKTSDEQMDEFLRSAGIVLLRDQSVLIDQAFYVIGRQDYSTEKKAGIVRATPEELVEGLDQSKPIIVIDHQPRELQELSDAGVDLDLCGHTHDGQLFPGNIATAVFWENSCGYLRKGSMQNIVTSGVGLWGPNLRVGTNSEVCIIDITFE